MTEVTQGGRKLLPCPFCGGPGALLRTAVDGSSHIVGCADCSCCIGIQGATEAITAWNARAPDPLLTILRTITEDDITAALADAYVGLPITSAAEALELFNRVLDYVTKKDATND